MRWGRALAEYTYDPQTFDGQDLTASPFSEVKFRPANSPVTSRPMAAIGAAVVGRGTQDVRAQPRPIVWELHCILTGSTDALLLAFHKVFNEDRGLPNLVANDGDGNAWRAACRVIGVDRHPENKAYFIVKLYVPNPVWEENAADTDTADAMSGDSGTMVVANAGNRKARPTLTVTPQTVKNTLVHDFALSLRGFVVNRSLYPWKHHPVQLFATADGSGSYDTAALVKVAADTALVNEPGDVTAAATEIDFDTPGGGGLDTPDGMIYIDNEQIYYTGNTGTQLTGCVRGIGGTTAATHLNNATITRSQMLENGDDIVVWINGVRVERWLIDMNTAATKLWVNLSGPARKKMTVRSAVDAKEITAGDPADGGTLRVEEDISDMPESGQVVTDDELITYTGRDLAGKGFTTIERGAWGTTAASHTAGSDPVYRCDYLFVIGASMGRATFFPPDAPIERRPCIQLKASHNNKHYWGDEGDDAFTAFRDHAYPNRSAQWRPLKQQADDDRAEVLRLEQSEDQVGWEDSDPEAGKLGTNRLTLGLPVPIEAAANAITYDAQKRADIRLFMLGRDEAGLEAELASLQDVAEGAVAGGQITPTSRLTELSLMAVRATILGSNNTGEDLAWGSVADDGVWQKFILDEDSLISAVQLRLKYVESGGAELAELRIYDNSSPTDPAAGNLLYIVSTGISTGTLALTYARKEYTPTARLHLAAGTYWLAFVETSGGGGDTFAVDSGDAHTKHDQVYLEDAVPAFVLGKSMWFRLIHDETGPIQPEAKELNGSAEADFDKVILDLDDAAGDNMVPQVRREASFGVGLYHCNAVLTNDLNPDTLTLDVWVPLTDTLTIDCEDQIVTLVEGNHSMRIDAAVTPSDITEWASAEPGTSTFTWTEDNMTDTDLASSHRGAKV